MQDSSERSDAKLNEVADALEAIRATVILEAKEQAAFRAEMRAKLDATDERVEKLDKVVVTGNGQKPLAARVAVLEAQQKRGSRANVTGLALAGSPGLFAFVKGIVDFLK